MDPEQWPTTLHTLREGWRAHTWSQFQKQNTRASQALRHTSWATASPRLTRARSAWLSAPPDLRAHTFATITNQWNSQAKLASNQNQWLHHCRFCQRQTSPTRLHEWQCTSATPLPPDPLFQHLGWPSNGAEALLLLDLANVRRQVLADRYEP